MVPLVRFELTKVSLLRRAAVPIYINHRGLVRMEGLEPSCLSTTDFKSVAYTNFATFAKLLKLVRKPRIERDLPGPQPDVLPIH